MTEAITSNLDLKEFRCFQCQDYLSTPPIMVLPNGNSLCGICSTSCEDTIYKNLTLEKFLKTVSYPCKYETFGCKAALTFGRTQEHHTVCTYRPMNCPVLSSCTWEGTITQMFSHFETRHHSIHLNNLEFKVDLKSRRDQTGLQLTSLNGVYGILKYCYSAATGNLQYDIRHFNPNAEEVSVKLTLTNFWDLDFNVSMKVDFSRLFDNSFYRSFDNISNPNVLPLNTYLTVLNNPVSINIAMKIYITKKFKQTPLVENEAIEKLKCHFCQWYLLPPLYKCGRNTACWYCRTRYPGSEPDLKAQLLENVEKALFPCRWKECDVILQGGHMVKHELRCAHRLFRCFVVGCIITATSQAIVRHLKSHGYTQICRSNFYTPNIFQNSRFYFYISSKGDFISIKTSGGNSVNFVMNSEYENDIIIHLKFEHKHCKIISKTFTLTPNKTLAINTNQLPPCFADRVDVNAILAVQS